jgi:hypothetical protein
MLKNWHNFYSKRFGISNLPFLKGTKRIVEFCISKAPFFMGMASERVSDCGGSYFNQTHPPTWPFTSFKDDVVMSLSGLESIDNEIIALGETFVYSQKNITGLDGSLRVATTLGSNGPGPYFSGKKAAKAMQALANQICGATYDIEEGHGLQEAGECFVTSAYNHRGCIIASSVPNLRLVVQTERVEPFRNCAVISDWICSRWCERVTRCLWKSISLVFDSLPFFDAKSYIWTDYAKKHSSGIGRDSNGR